MHAKFVRGVSRETLLDPEASIWRQIHLEPLAMLGVPSSLQPTKAVRAAFPEGTIGAVERVAVGVAHNGEEIAFLLEWQDPTRETGEEGQSDTGFPDAAAVMFPAAAGAPLMSMGAPGSPVNVWYWRADENGQGRHITSQGIGTTELIDNNRVHGRGVYTNGAWRAVILRAMQVEGNEPMAQLSAGSRTGVSFAVWEGGHQERGGIKAFTLGSGEGGWHELVIA